MQRRKIPQTLWLLALPFAGAIGWVIGRQMGRRHAPPGEQLTLQGQVTQPGQVTQSGQAARPERAARKAETAVQAVEPPAPPPGHAFKNPPESASVFYVLLVPFLILATAVVALALYRIPVQSQSIVPGGSPSGGRDALQSWGCGACHTIPGVTGATGKVGPALSGLSTRSFIGGHLQNTPDNMILWIMHPQQVSPGVDMPDTGVPESVARDMAAYLYSIH